MKIEVAKKDLDAAIRVVTIKEDPGEELSSHLLFRHLGDDRVEVLAYNARVGVSARVAGCQVKAGKAEAFTVESQRFRKWVGAFSDAVFTFAPQKGEVRATAAGPVRGAATFRSIDATQFPYWDATLEQATLVATVKASVLHTAFAHVRQFISDKDTTSPKLAVTEVAGGALLGTDKGALAAVTIAELKDSTLRIHGKDLPQVLTFLAACGDDEVEVREHANGVFFARPDREVLLAGRPQHAFPDIVLDTKEDDPSWWIVDKQHLRSAVGSVCATAVGDDTRVNFRLRDRMVVLSMAGVSEERTSAEIEAVDLSAPDASAAPMPPNGFDVSYEYLVKVLGHHRSDTVRFGLNPQVDKKTNKVRAGWVRFREDRDGADYLTILVWLQSGPGAS